MRRLNLYWRNWPLAVKLTLAMTILVVMTVVSITLFSIRREQQVFQAELQQQADLLLDALTATTTDPLYNLDVDFLQDLMEELGTNQLVASGRIYDAAGRVIADTASLTVVFGSKGDPWGERLVQSDVTVFEWQSEQMLAGRAVTIGPQRLGAISVGLLTAPLEAKVAAVRNQGFGAALAAAVAGALLGLLFSRSITNPLQELTQAAKNVAEGDLTQRLAIQSGDEFETLGRTFNSMTSQLQQTLARLQNYSQRLEVIASLSKRLSAILSLETLLGEVVNQVKDSFGYYHAHIYLLDNQGERLVVTEGTGSAGAEMKAKGHHILLDAPTSLVARAARTGQIVRVDNVREAEDWLPNPLLPDTYSEMAVPIILEEKVVGVLDVQQDKIAGLDEGDANLLRSLANQVAVAVRNARQFAEVEASLNEAREIQQRYIEQAWDRTRVTRKNIGRIQFSLGESTTLNETIIVEAQQQALRHKKPTVVALNGQQDHHVLVAPILLRNVAIGDLQLHQVDPERKWTESELALINAVIDQVTQAAETLRLLDETQERASREQLVSQISTKMRRAPDMESLLQVAVSELSRVLNPARTFVHVGSEAALEIQPSVSNIKENGDA